MKATNLRQIAAALAFAAFSPLASAQALWQAYTTGMTVDEVRRVAPEAELLPDDPRRVLPTNGAMQKLRLPGIGIVGKQFEADFYFVDDKLTDVHLVHRSKENIAAGRSVFNDLMTALRSKYGSELDRKSSTNIGWMGDATWASGGTTINLIGILYESGAFVQVGYSGRIAKDASKL